MKKMISLCLSLVMIFSLTAPAVAAENSVLNSEAADDSIVFEDSLGNEYI